ncbi:MAG: hypothetical protein JHC61_06300 [Burkholderiaceae bacterium]|nr:hypothetical protein [Burkholderiaceae bacterium]
MKYFGMAKILSAGLMLTFLNVAGAKEVDFVHTADVDGPMYSAANDAKTIQGIISTVVFSDISGNECRIAIIPDQDPDRIAPGWPKAQHRKHCEIARVAKILGKKVGLNYKYSPGGWGWYFTGIWVSDSLN